MLEAIEDTILLQAEVVTEGREHSDWCGTGLQVDDPERRLGIRVRYSVERGMGPRVIQTNTSQVRSILVKAASYTRYSSLELTILMRGTVVR